MRINGAALREFRQDRGLTIQQLADLVQLENHSHISNIEAGRRQASPALIKRLAEALRLPLIALLGPEPTTNERAEVLK